MAESFYVDPVLYKGRPTDCSGREAKEIEVYDFLDKYNIPYERADHDAAPTIEACEEVEKVLGTKICKNLFLRNQQKTAFYLLMTPGEKPFVTKDFSKQMSISRVSFAEESFMMELLGVKPGAVTVLGLMNDPDRDVTLAIDKDLLKDETIGCHPCVNTSTLKIRISDLLEIFLRKTGHSPYKITL